MVQGRPNGRVIRAPRDSLSVLTCSEASLRGRSRGGGMTDGKELSPPVKLGLRGAKEAGKRGVRSGAHSDAEEEVSKPGEVLAVPSRPEASSGARG